MAKSRGRILLVDDEPAVRSFIKSCLVSWRFDVVEVGDGLEALSAVEAAGGDFDLVVSDVQMPRMDGATLASFCTRAYPRIPVLLISGNPGSIRKMQAGAMGHRAFLGKPFLPDTLRQKVDELLGVYTQKPKSAACGSVLDH